MKPWLQFKVATVFLILSMLLAPAGVSASGYENIGGNAANGSITWYYSQRTVTNPASPGPEVAFILYSKSSSYRLFLGTHNCSQGDSGPIYEQRYNLWEPVRYYSSPTVFCMLTYGVNGGGSFNGDLNWD